MRTLCKGRIQSGWAIEAKCSGHLYGGGGCDSKLLVEQGDVYRRISAEEVDEVYTFTCPECGVQTALKSIPQCVPPDYQTWFAKQDRKKKRDEMIQQAAINLVSTVEENRVTYNDSAQEEQRDALKCDIYNAIKGLFERYDHS